MLSFMVSESESEVAQSCPTLCDPMDCSPPGSSVHGIFQARLLEWVAISFSSRSSQPRDRTRVSHMAGRRFTNYILIREYLPTLKSWGYFLHLQNILFLFSLTFKPTIQESLVLSLGRENPLEKEMATHSSNLAWKFPWTEAGEPYTPQHGVARVRHDLTTKPPPAP